MSDVYLTRDAAARSSKTRAKWHWTRTAGSVSGPIRVTACASLPVDALEFGTPADMVAPENRCRANGCRALWPAEATS